MLHVFLWTVESTFLVVAIVVCAAAIAILLMGRRPEPKRVDEGDAEEVADTEESDASVDTEE